MESVDCADPTECVDPAHSHAESMECVDSMGSLVFCGSHGFKDSVESVGSIRSPWILSINDYQLKILGKFIYVFLRTPHIIINQ